MLLLRDQTPNVLGFSFGIVQMVLYMIYKNKSKHGILPVVNIDMEMQVNKHVNVIQTDLEMPEDDIKKNVKIELEMPEDDTKKNEQNSKPADHQEVVVSVVITTDHEDKEANVQCNTILAVEY